jgi:rhodanese-related sulfurtransferase
MFGQKKEAQEELVNPTPLVQIKAPESSPAQTTQEKKDVSSPSPRESAELSGDLPMSQLIELYPAAQRALFQKYHVGGCHSCGYDMNDTLEQVCASHGLQVNDVREHILHSQKEENAMQVSPQEVAEQLKNGSIKLLDVRSHEERDIARIEGTILLDEESIREIIGTWSQDTAIVTHCHHGMRSLDAAAYLKGHGFANVKSMQGGIDAWSEKVDSSVPRY